MGETRGREARQGDQFLQPQHLYEADFSKATQIPVDLLFVSMCACHMPGFQLQKIKSCITDGVMANLVDRC